MKASKLWSAIRARFLSKECDHRFDIGHLRLTGESADNRRVSWPCMKCGKEFYAQCGLDIAHAGNIVRDTGGRHD